MVNERLHQYIDNMETKSIPQVERLIEKYDVISFDVFDTLLKRDVPKPVDAFNFMGKRNGIKDFKRLRIDAEVSARSDSNNGEVTLEEIYQHLKGIDEAEIPSLVENEKKVELQISCPNKEILPLFERCIKSKKVILITDMYLDTAFIEKLLQKNGIEGYSKLYVSNELDMSKSSGSLFDYVIKDQGIRNKQLLHIGNSFKADYLKPNRIGINAVKISTNNSRTTRRYSDLLCEKSSRRQYFKAFINNHTCFDGNNWYESFGYERFGPLLYGFVNWLYSSMKKKDIEQVFFLARDGFIMQQAYHKMAYDTEIPDKYFEASRRSLRIPSYRRDMSYEQILHELTVPNKTTVVAIFDSLGLKAEDYKDIICSHGFNFTEQLKRDELSNNEKFHALYDVIHEDIISNAEYEGEELERYLKQFDFSKKTALVDIGWGGSMQKYLCQTLDKLNIVHDITGYYVGLTTKSKENLGSNDLSAFGYAFDVLNNSSDFDMERPFVGLFETLFLEQDGSVMRYTEQDDRTVAVRYPYEYLQDGKGSIEAIEVKKIQQGALQFVEDYKNSLTAKYVGYESTIMFSNLYQTGVEPKIDDVDHFGDFTFFNNGTKVYLAKPQKKSTYAGNPNLLMHDLFDSQWKVGFLKRLCVVDLPYLQMFQLLRKMSN